MLMKEKQKKKRRKGTLSWRSIPPSPRLKTHSFVKYLTHLCSGICNTSHQLVWEKGPPTGAGSDNLAQPDNSHVRTNTERTRSRFINGSFQKWSLEGDANLVTGTKPVYASPWRRADAPQTTWRGGRGRHYRRGARQVSRLAAGHQTVQA